jgi:hypothetical protein
MHGSRSKIPSKKSRPYIYIYDIKFLALLGAPHIYDISRLRVNRWPDGDPIVGSKIVALINNKSPFVVFDGFFYIYFAHTMGWPLLNMQQYFLLTTTVQFLDLDYIYKRGRSLSFSKRKKNNYSVTRHE